MNSFCDCLWVKKFTPLWVRRGPQTGISLCKDISTRYFIQKLFCCRSLNDPKRIALNGPHMNELMPDYH